MANDVLRHTCEVKTREWWWFRRVEGRRFPHNPVILTHGLFHMRTLIQTQKEQMSPVFNKRLQLSFLPWYWWLCVKAFWRSTGMWDCSDITRSREKCVNTRLHRQNKKKPCCQATSCAFVSRPPASGPARTREVSAIAAAKAFLVSELDRTRGFSPWKMCFFSLFSVSVLIDTWFIQSQYFCPPFYKKVSQMVLWLQTVW